jgi:hypothetical protein
MEIHSTHIRTTLGPVAELDRLGDEIAELSAHLEAATACLLDLVRVFDARGGWSNGFRSCADWLSWRIGLDPGAARETARQHASRALHVRQDADGTVVLRGRLDPEVGALLMRALAAARETPYQRVPAGPGRGGPHPPE